MKKSKDFCTDLPQLEEGEKMAENKKDCMMRARTLEHFRATGRTFTGTYQDSPLPEEQREVGGPDKGRPGGERMRTAM